MYIYGRCVHVSVGASLRLEALDSLKLELQVVVS